MTRFNAEEIIKGIRQHDRLVLQYVYKTYFQFIKFFVNRNSSNDDDAEDVYQHAIIIIYKKAKKEDFKINCLFKTYLYSVCRILWLKELEKKKIKIEKYWDNEDYIDLSDDILTIIEKNERYKLYQSHFLRLEEDCQKVLRLSLNKVPLKKIAQIMGYKSKDYAKKRKFKCKEKLMYSIKNDSKFNELVK